MRSIFIHFSGTTQKLITDFLKVTYPSQENPWVYEKNGDSYLYIDFFENLSNGTEDGEIEAIEKKIGGKINCSLIIDISGRHPGDSEVLEILNLLLTSFNGVAQDDYTIFPWNLNEINSNLKVQGHRFFDYNGWYKNQD